VGNGRPEGYPPNPANIGRRLGVAPRRRRRRGCGPRAIDTQSAADPVSLRRAIGFYRQAVALDPGFLPAWSQLVRARAVLYVNGHPYA
jgi:hypothetical protein